MEKDYTVREISQKVVKASNDFETTNSDLKRKYLLWCIYTFNKVASKVSTYKGTFGTGYPFYALDSNLQGELPIINEQLRYNRQLLKDGEKIDNFIWKCQGCLRKNYSKMPDLKTVCKPCGQMLKLLKPRKLINRLPDIDMWIVCEDGMREQTQSELELLLEQCNMHTSDKDPIITIEQVLKISQALKNGEMPEVYLPIDAHVVEYSEIKELIENAPEALRKAKEEDGYPYLQIHPKSLRKHWQYDDEPYNFIYDFLAAFTSFDFTDEIQQSLDNSRYEVSNEFSEEELFKLLLNSANNANYRRFQEGKLKEIFIEKIKQWKSIDLNNSEKTEISGTNRKKEDGEIIDF